MSRSSKPGPGASIQETREPTTTGRCLNSSGLGEPLTGTNEHCSGQGGPSSSGFLVSLSLLSGWLTELEIISSAFQTAVATRRQHPHRQCGGRGTARSWASPRARRRGPQSAIPSRRSRSPDVQEPLAPLVATARKEPPVHHSSWASWGAAAARMRLARCGCAAQHSCGDFERPACRSALPKSGARAAAQKQCTPAQRTEYFA